MLSTSTSNRVLRLQATSTQLPWLKNSIRDDGQQIHKQSGRRHLRTASAHVAWLWLTHVRVSKHNPGFTLSIERGVNGLPYSIVRKEILKIHDYQDVPESIESRCASGLVIVITQNRLSTFAAQIELFQDQGPKHDVYAQVESQEILG